MFLDGYKRNWLHTEGLAFEDRMIDDLSVSTILSHSILSDERFPACLFCVFAAALCRRRWRKRRRKKRRKRRSLILFISSSFTSAAPLSQRKGERDEVLRHVAAYHWWTFCTVLFTQMKVHQWRLSLHSKLDIDYLYMAYADIMAKVGVMSFFS